MKAEIHPPYYQKARVRCACGNTFEVGATVPSLDVEICSACHPFFLGVERLVDTRGKVERFEARRARAKKNQERARKTKGHEA